VATARQIQETIDFCVATMVRFQDARRTRHTTIQMIAETQAHAAWILDLGMQSGETAERIFRPIEAALIARYGPEVGNGLNSEFLKTFDAFGINAPLALTEGKATAGSNGDSGSGPGHREPSEALDPASGSRHYL